jgi:hypothetical protein
MSDQYQGEPVKPSEVEQTSIRADAPAFMPMTTMLSFSADKVDFIDEFVPAQAATEAVPSPQQETLIYKPSKGHKHREKSKLKSDSVDFVPSATPSAKPEPVILKEDYPSLVPISKAIEAKTWGKSEALDRVKAPPPAPKQKTPKLTLANKPTIKITKRTEDQEALEKEAEAAPIEAASAGDDLPIDLQLTQETPETKEEEGKEDEVQELRPSTEDAPIQAEIKEQAKLEEPTLEEERQTEAELEETKLNEAGLGASQAESSQAQALEPVTEALRRGLEEETKEVRMLRPFTYDSEAIIAVKQVSPR